MIVAKTKMKRIPDTCKKCSVSYVYYDSPIDSTRCCRITSYECPTETAPSGNTRYVKPDWCPLMEIEV